MQKKGKYIGEMLVQKGLISEDQLQSVIQEQIRNKKFIGEMFVDKGLIEEDQLFATIAEQFNIDYVSLSDEEIDWDLVLEFSSSVAEHKSLPYRANEDTVILAITNPLDVWVVDAVEKESAPRKVKIVLTSPSEMEVAIKEYHRYSMRKMMNKWRKK